MIFIYSFHKRLQMRLVKELERKNSLSDYEEWKTGNIQIENRVNVAGIQYERNFRKGCANFPEEVFGMRKAKWVS